MTLAGSIALWCGTVLAVVALAMRGRWQRRASTGAAVGLSLALVVLATAFATDRFEFVQVARYSRAAAALPYKVAAVWGGMAGSLLLWATIAAWYSVWVEQSSGNLASAATGPDPTDSDHQALRFGWYPSVMGALTAVFSAVCLLLTQPFGTVTESVSAPSPDGVGMAPILEHPAMVIHPPLVYLGLLAAFVPIALRCVGISSTSPRAIGATRFAWAILTCAMAIGGWWAYAEVGWGGFWAWDPVENASLLPWLCLTGWLHGRNKDRWAIAAMLSALGGSVLVRGGAVSSVHAFAQSASVGWWVFAGCAVIAAGVIAWVGLVLVDALEPSGTTAKAKVRTASPWLRLNSWLLAIAVAVIALGTFRPLLASTVADQRLAVAPRYFAAATAPLALLALLTMGIGQTLTHDSQSGPASRRWFRLVSQSRGQLFLAGLIAFIATVVAVTAGAYQTLGGAIATTIAIWAIFSATIAFNASAPLRATMAHLALGVVLFGVAGSISTQTDAATVATGSSQTLAGYQTTLMSVEARERSDDEDIASEVVATVRLDGHGTTFEAEPRLVGYVRQQTVLPEIVLRYGLADVQVSLRLADDDGRALIEVSRKPLVAFVWIGAAMLGATALIEPLRRLVVLRRVRPTTFRIE